MMKSILAVTGIALLVVSSISGCGNQRDASDALKVRIRCTSHLLALHAMCCEFAAKNNGNLPTAWRDVAATAPKLEVFVSPFSESELGSRETVDDWADYRLVAGLTTGAPPDTVLAYYRGLDLPNENGNLLTIGGEVVWCTQQDFKTGKWRDSLWPKQTNAPAKNALNSNAAAPKERGIAAVPPRL